MAKISCSQCGKSFQINDEFVGRKGKCPNCGNILHLTAARAKPEAEGNIQITDAKQDSGLATTSLVLGIIAILSCGVPALTITSISFGGLGLAFGIITWVNIKRGKAFGTSLVVSGSAMSLVAVILSLISLTGFAKAETEADKTQNQIQPPQASASEMDNNPDDSIEPKMNQSPTGVISEPIYGVYLGEKLSDLSTRFTLKKKAYKLTPNDPFTIYSLTKPHEKARDQSVFVYQDRVVGIALWFRNGSEKNYNAMREEMARKYDEPEDFEGRMHLSKTAYWQFNLEGVPVRIMLKWEDIIRHKKLTAAYFHMGLAPAIQPQSWGFQDR
jgi:predicted RNA-binding Zn-ribbon protein involved in translation (DUF1610 family)